MRVLLAFSLICAPLLPGDEVETKEVVYQAGEVSAKGLLAHPKDGKKHPCVVVVHEWWGNNEYARGRAEQIAGLGYTVLALDMYGEGRSTINPREASFYSSLVYGDQDEMKARFRAGMRFLMAQEQADPKHVAAVGYCFGANIVLQMARNGQRDLDGVVSFHSSLEIREPNPPSRVKAKVLVCHGGEDAFAPPERLSTFTKAMKAADADLEVVTYPKAFHAFTNPKATETGRKWGLPVKYDEAADLDSWKKMQQFLSDLFKEANPSLPKAAE